MICIKTQYFNLHRILLLAVGLWPYKQSKLVQLQLILFFGILISFIVSQFAVFLFAECTTKVTINVLSIALLFMMFMIKYNSFRINTQTQKQFLEELQHIYNNLEDKNEIAIVEKYGNNAKRYTAIITLIHLCNLTTIASMPLLPLIPGIVFINEYQLRHVLQNIMPVYYVNQEKYLYLLLLHAYTTCFIGGTVLLATGITLISYLKHACGMFKIASYRIEKALTKNMKNDCLKNEFMIYKEIIYAVHIHRKAIQFSEVLFSNFQGSHFFAITTSVICVSLNLYGISETATLGDDVEQFVIHLLVIGAIFLYLFLMNYAGQEITDHNDHVFFTVYNVRWYLAPLHVQKLILFLLQRGRKTVNLQLGGVFALSLEFFATLTKASISYFTVVCSMQQ